MELPIYQIDAFTDSLFRGNPAAVVPLERWLPDELMQEIAQENNLAETAFFVSETAGFRLRWFTPTVEVNLCGHATIASAHVLYEHLGYEAPSVVFYSRSGPLPVIKNRSQYILNFPTDTLLPVSQTLEVAQALGRQPKEVLKGREDWVAIFEDQQTIEDLRPDFRKVAALGGRGLLATAPGQEADFVSRCFFPQSGVEEDPVTGSAHTTLTPYWASRLGKNDLKARQLSRRGGSLSLKLLGDRVEIGGGAVTYLVGKIFI